MKITLISDTHFSTPTQFSSINEHGLNTRFVDQLSVFDLIPEDTDVLIHLGDVFHNRFRVSHQLYNTVYDRFDSAPGRHKIIVVGNHDLYQYDTDKTLVPFMKVAAVVSSTYTYYDLHGIRFHCVPYNFDSSRLQSDVASSLSNLSGNDILLTHAGVEGAKVGASNLVIKSDITLKNLYTEHFAYVLLGHYHKYQQLAENTYYIGSPLQHNFGECGEIKGIATIEDGKFTFIQNNTAPTFNVISVSSEDQIESLAVEDGNFYRVDVRCDLTNIDLNSLVGKGNVVVNTKSDRRREVRIESESTIDILSEYITLRNTELNRERLLKIGKDLL